MKLIVGLGNPGIKYEFTRHNIGFLVLDRVAEKLSTSLSKDKFKAKFNKVNYKNEDIVLLKPLAYMNLSGESVLPALKFFKIDPKDILVVHDELDIAFGKMKFKKGGGFAGHNGLKSIGASLSRQEFNRLRVGIGRPVGPQPVYDYVLQKFSNEDVAELDDLIEKSADAVIFYLENNILDAMNQFHGG